MYSFQLRGLERVPYCYFSSLPPRARCQTKDYKIGKNAALRNKNKEWSGQNQNNVSEWNDISTHRLLFQWTSTLNIQLRVLFFSFFVSKCVSCCSCLNSLHITCYSLCFLFKNSMNRMFLSPIWVLFFM